MNQNKVLEINEVIPCYGTDFHKYLRPSAFMDYAQELAYRSATELGFGYNKLIKDNRAWVLSRFHIIFSKPVHWGDHVKIQTWHKGPSGLFYLRDFCLLDEQGRKCITATSSWIILDLENRSLVRTDRIDGFMPADTECHDNAIEQPCPKVAMPRGVQDGKVGEHVVNYSDIDCLGHTNNVRYVVWSMDAAGPDITFRKPLKELFINFNKETHLGETVELFRFVEEGPDGAVNVTIEGKVGNVQSFCCKLVF